MKTSKTTKEVLESYGELFLIRNHRQIQEYQYSFYGSNPKMFQSFGKYISNIIIEVEEAILEAVEEIENNANDH